MQHSAWGASHTLTWQDAAIVLFEQIHLPLRAHGVVE
jgi:hypothetical protein